MCPHCGFSLENLDKKYGRDSIPYRRVCDNAGALRQQDRVKLNALLEKLERRIPPVLLSVYFPNILEPFSLIPHSFWMMNHLTVDEAGFPNHQGPLDPQWLLVLVLDVRTDTACFMWGYELDPYVEPDLINKSIMKARIPLRESMLLHAAGSIMKDAGFAHMGVGVAKGAGKAENAAKAAISSPLLETSIAGARGVIINITSSPDIGLEDVETAAGLITQSAHPDANIIWGTAFDENLSDEMRVTVVATGFDNKAADGLRSSLNNAAGAGASTPSAVFSSDVSGAGAAKQQPAAAANSAAKPVEEESSDNRYYDELLAILNKRK